MPAAAKPATSPVARHIARVAARLFAERGYDATSIREIVSAAGVAKPTLYYYFRNKEGLASALLTVPLADLVSALRQIVTTAVDPVLCLEQVIDAQYAFCRENPDRGRIIYALLFGPHGAEVASELEPFRDSLVSWTEAAVRRLAESGILSRGRVDRFSIACRGLIVISTLDFLYRDRALGVDLARQQVDDLLRGFREPDCKIPDPRTNAEESRADHRGIGYKARPQEEPGSVTDLARAGP
jgi:AcrR family transcriptional regulator